MDPTTEGKPQEGDPTTNPQPQAGNTTPPTPQDGGGKKQLTLEDYEQIVADLRKEQAGNRTKLKKLEDEERARAEAQMTDQQKLQKQYDDLQATHNDTVNRLQKSTVNYEVRLQASQLGIANPAVAAKLLDSKAIVYDDAGSPTNIEALLKQLIKDEPYLVPKQSPSTSGGATNPSRSASSMPQEITREYYDKIVSDPGAYERLSAYEKTRLANWLYQQRKY